MHKPQQLVPRCKPTRKLRSGLNSTLPACGVQSTDTYNLVIMRIRKQHLLAQQARGCGSCRRLATSTKRDWPDGLDLKAGHRHMKFACAATMLQEAMLRAEAAGLAETALLANFADPGIESAGGRFC